MQLRILTYNIHKCIGGIDRRYDPDRIVETLSHYEPDLALLQEVDCGVPRSRGDHQLELLADRLGYAHSVFQPNVKLKQGCYGNGILSRFPIESSEHCDLTVPLKKRRRALLARVRVADGDHSRRLLVVNLHLGLAGFERTMQIRKLLANVTLQRTHQSTPTIVAGDFNDVWLRLGISHLTPAGFTPTGQAKTFPAVYPVRALDRIYFRGDMTLATSYRGTIRTTQVASDHLPLIADFELK